jgi:hypothetical protein
MIRCAVGFAMLLGAGCGGGSSDGGGDADADADSDGDSDADTDSGGDCAGPCDDETAYCGTAPDECVSSCETAGASVDFTAWQTCLDGITPPCGQLDPNCCIRASSCRGF